LEERVLTVSDIMTSKVITVSKEENVAETAKLMVRHGIGSVIIVEDGKPVGIVTEKDILDKVVSQDKRGSEVKVSEIMSTPLITVEPESTLEEAIDTMARYDIRRLPVVRGDTLLGIVTSSDVIRGTSEYSLMKEENIPSSGICEVCGEYTDVLIEKDGKYLCPSCAEELD